MVKHSALSAPTREQFKDKQNRFNVSTFSVLYSILNVPDRNSQFYNKGFSLNSLKHALRKKKMYIHIYEKVRNH